LSLDLDNKWSYLRTHGVDSWQTYPSYLDTVAPRIVDFCAQRDAETECDHWIDQGIACSEARRRPSQLRKKQLTARSRDRILLVIQ